MKQEEIKKCACCGSTNKNCDTVSQAAKCENNDKNRRVER